MKIEKILEIIKDKIRCYIWKYKEGFNELDKVSAFGDTVEDIIRYYKEDNKKGSSFGICNTYGELGFIWEKLVDKDRYLLAYALKRYSEYIKGLESLEKKYILYIIYDVYYNYCVEIKQSYISYNAIPIFHYGIYEEGEKGDLWTKIRLSGTKICEGENEYTRYYKGLLKDLELDKYFCVRSIYDKEEKEYKVIIDLKEDYEYKRSICKSEIVLY